MAPRNGPSRRAQQHTAEMTSTPPDTLTPSQTICKIVKAAGNNLYTVTTSSDQTLMVELPAKFRSTIWMKRGGYVLVDREGENVNVERRNKIEGEIVNVVREEKEWRKRGYWPKEFVKKQVYEDSDEEESVVGKMPPSDSEDEREDAPVEEQSTETSR